jgi:ubiquinone/menaquinone biosynthesis C-methylase UbiE
MTQVKKHFDQVAKNYDQYKENNKFYYDNLKKLLSSFIPKDKHILEIGCGTGDLLASLNPKVGYGLDLSPEMIKLAKIRHSSSKNLSFSTQSINKFKSKNLNFIFMADVIEHLEDPQKTFTQISQIMTKNTIFICTYANPIWEPVLMLAEKLKLKMPEGDHYRIKFKDIESILKKSDLELTTHNFNLLLPINIPLITTFTNKYLAPILKPLCFIEYFVAQKR